MKKSKWTTDDMPDQGGRVAIVTGGNSGIGFETAKALADSGAAVVVASRSLERGQKAMDEINASSPKSSVQVMQLDLASQDSVKRFAAEFSSKFDRLDLLINNAGVMMPPERQETADGFELQFGTNHLGHFALTVLLMDVLGRAPGSRVVNVSSSAQNWGGIDLDDLNWTTRDFKRAKSYGASKVANMLFTLELQRRLTESGIDVTVTAAHPGWTATNLQASTPLFRMLNPIFAMKPWQGALPTLYAAVSEDVKPAGYYGPDGFLKMRGYPTVNQPAAASLDAGAARRLWALSESMVGMEADFSSDGVG